MIPIVCAAEEPPLQNLFEMAVKGGPVMVPIALCSVVALAYVIERAIRLRAGNLGGSRFRATVVEAAKRGGPGEALAVCGQHDSALSRILSAGLKRAGAPFLEVEKVVEDAGAREVRRLSANLKPLVVVAAIAPLLGLLGTVWGMIEAFTNIAVKEGLGKPELLAGGISQALITTAAGLVVAIPAQAFYHYFKGKIDRFVRDTEDLYLDVAGAIGGSHAHP